MTFNQLFIQFQTRYGTNHDVIFFTLVFYLSKQIKNKENFVLNKNNAIDFSLKKFNKLCDDYFVKQKPLAHITKHIVFCDVDLIIEKKVLSPRDITQQMTWDFIHSHQNETSGNVLDLCCGSGCIGIAIKKYIPSFNVTCVDKYWRPLLNTYANAHKHKIALTIDHKDAIEYLNSKNHLDYLISNPPYINEANFNNTQMYRWEKKQALVAHDNGLYFYKKYFEWLGKHTFKEAWFEVGYDLVEQLKQELKVYPDLVGIFNSEVGYLVVKRNF